MAGRREDGCGRQRDAILELVDRRLVDAGTEAALDHVDRCPACRADLEGAALAVTGLRRLATDARRADPPEDAWLRLRRRVRGPVAPTWRWRTPVAAGLVGAWLIGALVGPVAVVRPGVLIYQETGVDPAALMARGAHEDRAETDRLQHVRAERAVALSASRVMRTAPITDPLRWTGPDGRGPGGSVLAFDAPATRAD